MCSVINGNHIFVETCILSHQDTQGVAGGRYPKILYHLPSPRCHVSEDTDLTVKFRGIRNYHAPLKGIGYDIKYRTIFMVAVSVASRKDMLCDIIQVLCKGQVVSPV
jgi:hypothetical protein